MALLKYVGSVINLGNSFSQATRPSNVGQISDLIQEYRNSTTEHSVEGWREFYISKYGEQTIKDASDKIADCVDKIIENLKSLTREDIYNWTEDLIITKSFDGLQIQLEVLQMVAEETYRLATSEEESKGIDGYVDGVAVSIKPHTYKKTINSGKESIPYKILYYKKTKNGLVVSS